MSVRPLPPSSAEGSVWAVDVPTWITAIADPRISQAQLSARGERPYPVVVAHVMNTSEQPVYNVIISWHLGTMPKNWRNLMLLMPGAEDKDIQPVPPDSAEEQFGAVAFFRDAAGVTWRTRPDGQL